MSLQKLKALTAIQQRKAAAILGALISDAATAPLHWIYDQDKVKALASEKPAEFYPTSQCPFYIIPSGNNSAYGSQLLVTLRNVAENKGFDAGKLADALFKEFGPGTEYEKVRQQSGNPKQGPWTNHNLKIFIANREEGTKPDADPTSTDPDGLCKAVIVVSLLSGKEGLLGAVRDCVGTTQSNPVATDYALGGAALLDSIIQTGSSDFEAAKKASTDTVTKDIDEALKETDTPHKVAVTKFGLACGFPGSFKGMIQGVSASTGYSQAIHDGILAAGDNCSRNTFIGACVGGKYGLDSIPEDWLKKYNFTDEVVDLIERVATL